jgi:hypothetical protein
MADSIEMQLEKILQQQVKMENGKTLQQNLEGAIRYLYQIIDNHIREYYLSYEPREYERTFDFMDSLYAENFLQARVVGNRIELSVSFVDSMAYHYNFNRKHKSYIPILINCGWKAPKLEQRIGKVYRFTYYEGYHFIEKSIKQFNSQNPYGVYISLSDVVARWEGKEIKLNGLDSEAMATRSGVLDF